MKYNYDSSTHRQYSTLYAEAMSSLPAVQSNAINILLLIFMHHKSALSWEKTLRVQERIANPTFQDCRSVPQKICHRDRPNQIHKIFKAKF